jgi:hypothetical protein
MIKSRYFAWIAAASLLTACDSPLEVDPTAQIASETALNTPRGIELALNGVYRSLQSGALYSLDEMMQADLYADNLTFTGTFQTHRDVSLRNVPTSNTDIRDKWGAAYIGINRANNVLDAAPNAGLTAALAGQYRGEALFVRALHYFTLVRWFGDVPIVLAPSKGVDPVTSFPARESAANVYARIVTDLEEAVTLLPAPRVNGRATRGAAQALLARVYLERGATGDYALAVARATSVIGSGLYSMNALYRTNWTTKHSPESIFEISYSVNNTNNLAFWHFPQPLSGRWGFSPSLALFNSYAVGDTRRDASIAISPTAAACTSNCRYGIKYFRIATSDDNVPLLRLAEMYLIRAEANARLGTADATVQADINTVRARAGATLAPVTATGQAALLTAILDERRWELAMEGHRFFDLRRHGVATTVLGIAASRLLFPVPQSERDVNINLSQNTGY